MSALALEALVISLPGAEGRRRLMRGQLDQPGMPRYRLVDGVDGRSLGEAELAGRYDDERTVRDYGRSLSLPEIGCALGHVAAYREAVSNGMPLTLVFEDDALLGYQFLQVLDRLVPMVDLSRPEVLLLSHVGRYSAWGARRVDKIHQLYRPYTAWGGHAYLMTLPAAKALLESQQPVHVMPDSWIYFMKAGIIEVRALVPYVVGTAPLAARTAADERFTLEQGRGLRRWMRKYLWQKFVFQVVVKPALRLRKHESTW